MTDIKDVGTAFPITHANDTHATGMSLRDYFAAKAMTAMLTHEVNGDWPEHQNVAMHAYNMADAMLAEREKGSAQ